MQRVEKYDSDGNLIEVIDDRTLEFAKEQRILNIKHECTKHILDLYPDFKQRNAGMGIYSTEENERIINGVKDCIDKCNRLETLIQSQTTKEDVDIIHWGTEI